MNRERLVSFNTRLPMDLKKEIKMLALKNDITIQELIQILLRLGIDEYKR